MALPKEIVVNILRLEYRMWIKLLTDDEIKAIHKYSYNSFDEGKINRFYERLNAMLRGSYNQDDTDILTKYADVISKAIRKHKLEHDIVCYRGDNTDYTIGLKEGTTFVAHQFVSTSVIDSRKLKRPHNTIIYVPKGTYGAYIEELSAYPKQREFLIDKETEFRMIGKENNETYLEVVGNENK